MLKTLDEIIEEWRVGIKNSPVSSLMSEAENKFVQDIFEKTYEPILTQS